MRLSLRGGRHVLVAPLVCYDAVMPALSHDAVRAGAELIVTLSNDAWFVNTAGARLHLVVSAFESVETHRAQLRATNTGISAAIDASGELIESLPTGARGAFVARVTPGGVGPTLAMRVGDGLGRLCALLTGLGIGIAWLRTARRWSVR
jgi:apolipoprotein N-acyltransferase